MASLRVVLRVPPRDSPAATASTSMSSTDEDASDDQRQQQEKAPSAKTPKKRKSSYHVRKEAMRELRDEEHALLTQLNVIRGKIRETGGDPFDTSRQLSLPSLLEQNRTLRHHVEMNRLAIAGAQSVTLSPRLEMSPLTDYIHLPRDPAERSRVLQRLKLRKVEDAVRFMLARVQPEDLRRRVRRTEMFYTDKGDHVSLDWVVTTVSQQDLTAKMVFDVMVENAHNHEMALADKLGVIAVRESEVCVESMDATEFRILVEHGPRFLIEKHLAVFSQYFERSELLDEPHGVVVVDHVDQDDLHPYQPLARIRKDITSVTMVLNCPRQETQAENCLPEVTVLKWSYGHVHKSPLASDEELQIYGREANLFDVGLQIIREQLAWKAS